MKSNNLYGGGFKGATISEATATYAINTSSILNRGVTWPFYRLTITPASIILRTPFQTITKQYSEVRRISLQWPASIVFQFATHADNFGFIYINPIKLIRLLHAQGLTVHEVNPKSIQFARLYISSTILVAGVILCIIIAGALGLIH